MSKGIKSETTLDYFRVTQPGYPDSLYAINNAFYGIMRRLKQFIPRQRHNKRRQIANLRSRQSFLQISFLISFTLVATCVYSSQNHLVVDLEYLDDASRVQERLTSVEILDQVDSMQFLSKGEAEKLKRRLSEEQLEAEVDAGVDSLNELASHIDYLQESLEVEPDQKVDPDALAQHVFARELQPHHDLSIEVPVLSVYKGDRKARQELLQSFREKITFGIVEEYGTTDIDAVSTLVEHGAEWEYDETIREVTFGSLGSRVTDRDECHEFSEGELGYLFLGEFEFFPFRQPDRSDEQASLSGAAVNDGQRTKDTEGRTGSIRVKNLLESSEDSLREELERVFSSQSDCVEKVFEAKNNFGDLDAKSEKINKKQHDIAELLEKINQQMESAQQRGRELAEAFPDCNNLSCMARHLSDKQQQLASEGVKNRMVFKRELETMDVADVMLINFTTRHILGEIESLAVETGGTIDRTLGQTGLEQDVRVDQLHTVYDQVKIIPYSDGQNLGVVAAFDFVVEPEDVCGQLKLGGEVYEFTVGGENHQIETVRVRGSTHYEGAEDNIELMTHEVSWDLFEAFANDQHVEMDNYLDENCLERLSESEKGGKYPIRCVRWEGALEFSEWMTQQTGVELDTIDCSVMQYVSTCGGQQEYVWGNNPECGEDCVENLHGGVRKVTESPEASIGAANLGGNVSELCRAPDLRFPHVGIVGPSYSTGPQPGEEKHSYRGGGSPDVGFRLGRVLPR
ncbi:hypothetical protein HH1059_25110 [Halorhodospira halochloris]|uniref:Uncharacterized protein n=1 Tax=Halorhodospira halochloris TaxID=1052 RepID=A0A110B4A9_HALHR|nr:SUMF1/EgtB/PvdO family nonheme iron enzyme [Halorhodospira halochloris]MBK1650909.1 hypothetical protein [Halorhodospira halochloris]BAU56588.1 hypothetical protein HH1059_25110 [Halorhodospira halochloris]